MQDNPWISRGPTKEELTSAQGDTVRMFPLGPCHPPRPLSPRSKSMRTTFVKAAKVILKMRETLNFLDEKSQFFKIPWFSLILVQVANFRHTYVKFAGKINLDIKYEMEARFCYFLFQTPLSSPAREKRLRIICWWRRGKICNIKMCRN